MYMYVCMYLCTHVHFPLHTLFSDGDIFADGRGVAFPGGQYAALRGPAGDMRCG